MDISLTMYKIINNKRSQNFELTAMSDAHAETVAKDLHERLGLIGRYYCETSTGKTFSVS